MENCYIGIYTLLIRHCGTKQLTHIMLSLSGDDESNHSRLWITNIHIIKEQPCRNEEEHCWMSHLALDQKHLWALLYPTFITLCFLKKKSQRRLTEVLWNHFQLWDAEQKRSWLKVSLCFHTGGWSRGERWGQAACTQHRAANSPAVSQPGRAVCLWALHLISPSVYSHGLDISTPTMGRGSTCELESIKSVEELHNIREFTSFKYTKS